MTRVQNSPILMPIMCLHPVCAWCEKCTLDDNIFELVNDVVILHDKYKITIKCGFDFDGVSVPRWAWSLSYPNMHKRTLIAGLVHDALYASQLLPKAECDIILRDILDDYKVGGWCSNKMYLAVKLCGGSAYDDCKEDAEYYKTLVSVEVVS